MKNIGIKDFILNRFDFEITLISGRKCCVLFSSKKTSISEHAKSIEKKLWHDTNVKTGENAFGSAIADIEDQLIRKRDEAVQDLN